jgi:hypothetical protein
MTQSHARDEEDLSGCLVSQPFADERLTSTPLSTELDNNDLSRCLSSMPLSPKKIALKSRRLDFLPIARDKVSGQIKVIDHTSFDSLHRN